MASAVQARLPSFLAVGSAVAVEFLRTLLGEIAHVLMQEALLDAFLV